MHRSICYKIAIFVNTFHADVLYDPFCRSMFHEQNDTKMSSIRPVLTNFLLRTQIEIKGTNKLDIKNGFCLIASLMVRPIMYGILFRGVQTLFELWEWQFKCKCIYEKSWRPFLISNLLKPLISIWLRRRKFVNTDRIELILVPFYSWDNDL